MDEKELRAQFNERALDEIREGVFEICVSEKGGYRDAINFVQGILAMVSALNKILDE